MNNPTWKDLRWEDLRWDDFCTIFKEQLDACRARYLKEREMIKMRVEITKGGKIKGWLKISEAAWVCDVSTSKMRKLAKDFLPNDKFELYGTLFLRGTKVDKLAKKLKK